MASPPSNSGQLTQLNVHFIMTVWASYNAEVAFTPTEGNHGYARVWEGRITIFLYRRGCEWPLS